MYEYLPRGSLKGHLAGLRGGDPYENVSVVHDETRDRVYVNMNQREETPDSMSSELRGLAAGVARGLAFIHACKVSPQLHSY